VGRETKNEAKSVREADTETVRIEEDVGQPLEKE